MKYSKVYLTPSPIDSLLSKKLLEKKVTLIKLKIA